MVTVFVQMLQPTRVFNILAERTPGIISNNLNNKFLSDGIELIKLNSSPNDEIIILLADQTGLVTAPDGILYLETKTSSAITLPDL